MWIGSIDNINDEALRSFKKLLYSYILPIQPIYCKL